VGVEALAGMERATKVSPSAGERGNTKNLIFALAHIKRRCYHTFLISLVGKILGIESFVGWLRIAHPRTQIPLFLPSTANMQKITHLLPFLLLVGVCLASLAKAASEEFPVSPPPLTEGIYPCSNCHASMEVNRKKRELKEEHSQIKLHHAETMRWCLDCHDAKGRDRLRLYNGELISFNESYRLCGECHGNLYRDWKAGIHGKRTGYFPGSGKRTYFLCAHCHDPHEPKFKPLKPESPPSPPTGRGHAK